VPTLRELIGERCVVGLANVIKVHIKDRELNMSDLRWKLIHVSLVMISLSVLSVGVAESHGAGLRGGDDGVERPLSASCVEDDLVTVAGTGGPGLAAERGALARAAREGHIASTAAVVQLADSGAVERALGALKRAMERQGESPGLLGAELGASKKCGSVRLLSVWQNEGSMLSAMTSGAFLAAMDEADSAGGTGMMTAWQIGVASGVGWEAAREKVAGQSPLY
jgi:hypothetical protein